MPPQSRHPRQPERRFRPGVVVLGIVIAVGGLAAALVASWPRTVDPRAGSAATDLSPVPVLRTPDSYRLVYRVDNYAGAENVMTTEKLWVQRPLDSRSETWSGPPPGEALLSTQTSGLGRLVTGGDDAQRAVIVIPPELAAGDMRFDVALSDTVAAGLFEPRETRRVAGRACTVYRSGQPPGAGLSPPRDDEHTDTCVDEAGLVLEEAWFLEGRLLRRRLATEVEETPILDAALFAVEGTPTIPVDQGGGVIRPVDPGSRPPGDFLVLDSVPAGFELVGRYAVVPPARGSSDDPLQGMNRIAGVTDVWARGPDLLILDQGGTRSGVRAFAPDPRGVPVDLGDLGEGEVIPDVRTVKVRATLGGGRFVRLLGTLPPDELVALARSLRTVSGEGDLIYID